ncbi:MAG: helix-turn-helix domain-containing protein [Chloroherpetonaceae bacterium]|nr:helix-turn-helix domain-containing protein [Chthonomonadaceae bacterium]MDW8206719.1 helix-turn-helix domain-containing protein [Chloroherpetonaceae bacterium]
MDLEARDLLTVEQAAQYLQVSQSSIRSYIRQGRLQAYRIAGKRKVLIPRAALLALLEPARPEMEAGKETGDENLTSELPSLMDLPDSTG